MAFDTADLVAQVNAQFADVTRIVQEEATKTATAVGGVRAELTELQQAFVADRRAGNAGGVAPTGWIGAQVTNHVEYQRFVETANLKGKASMRIEAALTLAPDSAGALVAPDRQSEVVALPKQTLTIRSLLAPGRTSSDLVQFIRQTGFTNAADAVSEGALKPESSLSYELAEAPVRTIAHWVRASKQAISDAPALQSLIDTELRYGLAQEEEIQCLLGDGSGEQLLGIIPQATTYAPLFSIAQHNRMDDLLLGIAEAQQAKLPATGIMVNEIDWLQMMSLKDQEGRYLGPGPFGPRIGLAWQVPVVPSANIQPGSFLVGAFALGAQLVDRWDTTVEISDSHADFFIRNMLAVLAEERVALAVKRPEAFVYGHYTVGT